jgi:hypothetical protein
MKDIDLGKTYYKVSLDKILLYSEKPIMCLLSWYKVEKS